MRILVTGATGLIGKRLCEALVRRGDEVEGLSRAKPRPELALSQWDPTATTLAPDTVAGFDVVVHLAGDNIGQGRWTRAKKARIKQSRLHGTRILSEALARTHERPRVYLAASAVGYYGSRGDETLSEESGPGSGFLSDVVVEWEEATSSARDAGVRVINARCGPVISKRGGMLAKMLPVFKLGLGGVVGRGDQYISWIALDDLVEAFIHLIAMDHPVDGPVNVVAPNPVTNREFTRLLGSVLKRPTPFPLPAGIARLVLGDAADELLLVSQRVSADRLDQTGFEFRLPHLQLALEHILATGR